MSLLFRVLYSWKCKGTHHKLAMDALRLVQHEQAARYRDLILANIEPYLTGAKDPDNKFKDFRNHVLHVSDGYWGGAVSAATLWYRRAVAAFQQEKWQQGVYACGVLSHYVTDPLQPLHTGQTPLEGTIHRPCEWSISQSYDQLLHLLETQLGGFPTIEQIDGDDWLDWLITQGAEMAHVDYDRLVHQYDFDKGIKNPPTGLNPELQATVARLIGLAAATFAVVLDHVFEEAEVTPPRQSATLQTALTAMTIPVFWVTRKLSDANDRKIVAAMYQELKQTGSVETTLPEDDRTIRELHAIEVLKQVPVEKPPVTTPPAASGPVMKLPVESANRSMPVESTPTATRTAAPPAPKSPTQDRVRTSKFYLNLGDPIVDAPSIGNKTADRLQRVGIATVAAFLAADVDDLAARINVDYITPKRLVMWQRQSRLMCSVPGLRGHDVQILVACRVLDGPTLAAEDAIELQERARRFVESPAASQLLRDPQPPTLEEVRHWIASASSARQLEAA